MPTIHAHYAHVRGAIIAQHIHICLGHFSVDLDLYFYNFNES